MLSFFDRLFFMKPAYSLVEMLMVISIMSYLMSISLPRLDDLNQKARYLEILSKASVLQSSVEACYLLGGDLSICQSGSNGIPKLTTYKTGIIKTYEVEKGGIVHIIPRAIYGLSEKDDYVLTPKSQKGNIEWHLSGGAKRKGIVH